MRLKSRAIGGMIGAGALAVLFAIPFSSSAGAADIVDRGAPAPKVSKASGTAAVASHLYRHPASAEQFWTRERMLSAKPLDNNPATSLDLPSLGSDAATSAATGDFTPANVTKFPQRIQGKIFMMIGDATYTCSGTVVDSASRNVVFTAGHCVYDQETHGYVSRLAFVPGYENGNPPFGIFEATAVYTPPQWINSGTNSYDLGVVSLDKEIQTELGSRKLAFDLNPMVSKKKRREYTLFGYPSKPSNLFDGETLRGCRVAFDSFDSTTGNIAPLPMAVKPCSMQQGASGGGWITLGNYLNSVTSYGYCDSLPRACGYIFGPFFSNAAKSLYVRAGGSTAPTVKLLKAPPKVVRKRKVKFSFGGSAATLLGFICKLDRQRPVNCSSKIAIARLSPGRHTLRVRAVDQTGNKSKRQIVRQFRVILPRR